MTFEDFKQSTFSAKKPDGLNPLLDSLWEAKAGNWDTAHKIVQDIGDKNASWIHAWLHRVDGDNSNAQYWYSRAGKSFFHGSLEEEWDSITRRLMHDLLE